MTARSYLQLLGTPRLTSRANGVEMPLPRKAFVLASILLLAADSSAPRAALAARLWEDLERDKALDNMRQLAGRIRGSGVFSVTRDSIGARRDIGSSDLALLLSFGPIATVYRVADREEALRLANGTTFGLSSAVWTNDAAEEDWFTRRLDAGAVFINGMTISYPELPFGGVKDSGVGRELAGVGIREFCNLKTVWKG